MEKELETELGKKVGIGKTKIGLVACVVLVIILAISSVWLYTRIDSLQNEIDTLESLNDNLQTQVNTLNSDIANLNSTVGLSITSLQDDLNILNSGVASLNSTLTNIEASVMSLQDELATLGSEVADLNSTVEMMEKRTWHEVYSIEASSDTTSGTFQLKGNKVRVMCFAHSPYTDAWVEIDLLYSNGTRYAIWGYSGRFSSDNAELEVQQAGDYLEIYTFQMSYAVSVWDYY